MDKKTPAQNPPEAHTAESTGSRARAGRHRFAEGETSILPLAEILRRSGVDSALDVRETTQIGRPAAPGEQGSHTSVVKLTPAQAALLQRTAPEPTVIARRPVAPPPQGARPPTGDHAVRPAQGQAAASYTPSDSTQVFGQTLTRPGMPAQGGQSFVPAQQLTPLGKSTSPTIKGDGAAPGRENTPKPAAAPTGHAATPTSTGVKPAPAPSYSPPDSALARAVEEAMREVQPAQAARTHAHVASARAQKKLSNHVVVVFSCKGGTGSTALSLNAAHAAARNDHTTCLVDMDLQLGDILAALGLQPKLNIAQCCRAVVDNEPLTKNLLPAHPSGISVLSQVGALDDIDQITPDSVARLVNRAREMFDVVVIDGVRDFSDNVLAVLDVADKIVVVTVQEVLAIRRARWVFGILRKIGFDASDVTLVVNRAEVSSDIPITSIQAMFAPAMVMGVPASPQLVTQSLNRGVPLREIKSQHPVTTAVSHLIDHVLYDIAPPLQSDSVAPKPTFWRKFFGAGRGAQA